MDLPRGLIYYTDEQPGCGRRRRGKGFAYYDCSGARIADRAEIARFNALAVPPAYRKVWLCPDLRGHLQSTGRDARGRKQYRYHADYRAFRDGLKFHRLAAFGRALGSIRATATRELARAAPGDKRYAVALVIKLLDRTGFRIGNESYLRDNGTRGLLTLSERHVSVEDAASRMEFEFTTKGGKRISRGLTGRRLVARVNRLQELPGQRLFVYRNERGGYSDLASEDVNAFLSEVGEEPFTAKDFRTWIGTREAAAALAQAPEPDGEKALQEAWKVATLAASQALANTVAIARSSYVHPDIYTEKALKFFRTRLAEQSLQAMPHLTRIETALVEFLG